MNKKLKKSILLTGLSLTMLTAGSSFAAGMEGPYVSGNLAASSLKTQKYDLDIDTPPVTLRVPSEVGWGGGLAVGSQNGPYRLEAALDYLTNQVGPGSFTVEDSLPQGALFSGKVSATTLLINGYYDVMPQATWTPYVGIGLGVAHLKENVALLDPKSPDPKPFVHDDANQFAYQGIVGASWKISDRAKANVDYRCLSTTKATFNVSGDGAKAASAQVKDRYTNNRVTAGMTYYFD